MRLYDWIAVVILTLCLGTLIASCVPKPAACQGNCPTNTCVNSAQCGLVCACIVPRHGRLGYCQYVY